MLFLLDANVLIEAKNLYYPIDRIPQFWAWILEQAEIGHIRIPTMVIEEIFRGHKNDELLQWVKANRIKLELSAEVDERNWSQTLTQGYGFPSTSVAEVLLFAERADPYLIAHALSDIKNIHVVTLEAAKSNLTSLPKPINRKIPTICELLGIKYLDTFELIRVLDFRIL